ncbi:MAG: N(4)-(beta-N-acetylglucosaminyl)-L-asparaginase [Vicingaceae bacterium]
MKHSRKLFLKKSAALSLLPFFRPEYLQLEESNLSENFRGPLVLSTWSHGMTANQAAMALIENGSNALDAAEAGVRVSESDPNVSSVGYGGLPDRDGYVTLDACIMDWNGNCGSVSFLQHIKNPISVARKVMEKTDHVMLSGEGALQFALNQGFKKENLLTDKAKDRWVEWKKSNLKKSVIDDHDTIAMLALDEDGQIAGACTTSGLAWKLHGRVGDSPIIGAGLFVDGKVGGAAATGKGESVIKIAGSHLIVELMRQGRSPLDACKEAVERIVEKQPDHRDFQVGFIACNIQGETGAYSLQKGFQYALNTSTEQKLIDSDHLL